MTVEAGCRGALRPESVSRYTRSQAGQLVAPGTLEVSAVAPHHVGRLLRRLRAGHALSVGLGYAASGPDGEHLGSRFARKESDGEAGKENDQRDTASEAHELR